MKLVVAAIIVRDGRILICQRTKDQSFPLQWEFPGGKVEAEETPVDALRRELEEELGIRAQIGPQAAVVRHTYNDGTALELRFYLVEQFEGGIENRIFHTVQWAGPEELPTYDFLGADIELVKDIARGKINLTVPAPRRRR